MRTSSTESGDAVNLATFDSMLTEVTSYGSRYNPAKDALKPAALTDLLNKAKTVAALVTEALTAYQIAIDNRTEAFNPIHQLVTKANNALKASDTSTEIEATADSLVRKLRGERASAKKTEEEKRTALAEGKSAKEISSAQTGIDNRIAFFGQFISLLTTAGTYAPNETELQIGSLQSFHDTLKAKDAAAITAGIQLSNARIERDKIFYNKDTGMLDIARDIKTYVKSAFGYTSPEYRSITKYQFKRKVS